jgi:tRNA (Thr-GGU) A37 N-methylase
MPSVEISLSQTQVSLCEKVIVKVEKQYTDAKKGLQDFSWVVTSGNSFAELDSLLD